MIVQENSTIEGKQFLHTYSDAGMKILQNETQRIYDDAMDVIPCRFTYTETDQPIDQPEPDEELAEA